MKKLELKADKTFVFGEECEAYKKSEADKVIAEIKAREDVLVTDNRNLLDKVKVLENQLRETAEHYKRNELQIFENAEKRLKKTNMHLKKVNMRLKKLRGKYAKLIHLCSDVEIKCEELVNIIGENP